MLFDFLKKMIENGDTEGLEERIEVFHNFGKITDEEYNELISMLHPEKFEK